MNTPTHPTDQANSPAIDPVLLESVATAMIRHDGLGDPDMVPSTVRAAYDALARAAIDAMHRPELEAEWEAERRALQADAWARGHSAARTAMRQTLRTVATPNPYAPPAPTPEPEPTTPPVEGLTVGYLEALPVGARVIDREGDLWERTARKDGAPWAVVRSDGTVSPALARNAGHLWRVWGPLRLDVSDRPAEPAPLTVEDLDAAPGGSVVTDGEVTWRLQADGCWAVQGDAWPRRHYSSASVLDRSGPLRWVD